MGGKDDYDVRPGLFCRIFKCLYAYMKKESVLLSGSDDWYWENVLMNEIKAKNNDLHHEVHSNQQPDNQILRV